MKYRLLDRRGGPIRIRLDLVRLRFSGGSQIEDKTESTKRD